MNDIFQKITQMPLIAILRGIQPSEIDEISTALFDGGFRFLEVTLNSPDWQSSLEILNDKFGSDIVLGAGTVTEIDQVKKLSDMGIKAIISPNVDVDVIKTTKELGMISIPGCYTPSECFMALKAGADILKIFPADSLGPSCVGSIAAVLPKGTKICPTGGVTLSNMKSFKKRGVFALGLGSAIYKPNKTAEEVRKSAIEFVATYNS